MDAFIKGSTKFGQTGQKASHLEVKCNELGGTLHFLKFATSRIENFFQLVQDEKLIDPRITRVHATGGGAYSFKKSFNDLFDVDLIRKSGEILALVKGVDLLLRHCPDECYYLSKYDDGEPIEKSPLPNASLSAPYVVVNIGSGVSILRVDGPDKYERIGGSALGGGTFLGLCRLLIGCETFEEALQLAEKGSSTKLDLLVRDIYGGSCEELNLNGDWIASYLGKLVRPSSKINFTKEDLARSILGMITNNIGSLANLYANRVLKLENPKIVFVGNFLTGNEVSKRNLTYSTEFWSKKQARAIFMKHEGYFGALGSLL